MKFEFLNKQEYPLSYLQENIELVIYSALCLLIPFFIGNNQFLIGAIVNASLILAALNLRNYKLLPIILLPSIGVFSRNLMFGNFTMFLVYMIPFIWIGNSILVFSFKKFSFKKKWFTLILAAALKTLFLFLSALVLIKLSVLPVIFLTTMGIMQFYTAITGGLLALSVHQVKKVINVKQ